MSVHQTEFYDLLDKYNDGDEPLENWETADIVKLSHVADAELQRRHDEEQARAVPPLITCRIPNWSDLDPETCGC